MTFLVGAYLMEVNLPPTKYWFKTLEKQMHSMKNVLLCIMETA